MNEYVQRIFECGIVPVIKLDSATDAVPLCSALSQGGIDVAEITFRTEAAEAAIYAVAEKLPHVLVGAGTVLTVENAKKALGAGAKFMVTPGFNTKVVEFCLDNDVLVVPGTSCPTDIEMGLSYGLDVLKFFPAEASGGIKALKAMSAPYSMVKFMPTGGIGLHNLADYITFDKIIACGGGWMVTDDLIKAQRFDEVTALSVKAVQAMHGFAFGYIGIGAADAKDAKTMADTLADMFGFAKLEQTGAVAVGQHMKVLEQFGNAMKGHIGIRVNNMARATAYFQKRGYTFAPAVGENGCQAMTCTHFNETLGGFSFSLI